MTDRKVFFDQLCANLDTVKQLFEQKNESYGKGDDAFHNFRSSAIRVFGEGTPDNMFKVLLTLADKHMVAVANKGLEEREFEQRMRDIVVYALIALGIYRERESTKSCENCAHEQSMSCSFSDCEKDGFLKWRQSHD